MASKHRCEVPIQFGDVTYQLRLDFNACADFQEKSSISIDAFFFRIQQVSKKYGLKTGEPVPAEAAMEYTTALGMDQLRIILWAGLRHQDPELTIKRAGELVNDAEGADVTEQFAYIVSKICDAYAMRQIGGKDKKKEKV